MKIYCCRNCKMCIRDRHDIPPTYFSFSYKRIDVLFIFSLKLKKLTSIIITSVQN